jgi:hypothetical protein
MVNDPVEDANVDLVVRRLEPPCRTLNVSALPPPGAATISPDGFGLFHRLSEV